MMKDDKKSTKYFYNQEATNYKKMYEPGYQHYPVQ